MAGFSLNIKNTLLYAGCILVVVISGFAVKNPYYLQILTFIGINTLLALGLNMLMGYAGQISLGHAAFYGIGAYTTAILTTTYQLSPWIGLVSAVLLSAFIAVVVGLPTLKLTGYYLGMGTLGFGMIVHIIFREWSQVTGGASGFVSIPPLTIFGYGFYSQRSYFFLVWAVVLLGFVVSGRIINSRTGRALRSIHDSEQAAAAVGINTMSLKLSVFVYSAVLSAVAGFLYAHLVTFISPGSFDFLVSVRIVTMVVIGGMATIWGSLFGASLLTLMPEFLHAFSELEMLVYGLILMVVMITLPQGLTRGVLDIYEHSRKKR